MTNYIGQDSFFLQKNKIKVVMLYSFERNIYLVLNSSALAKACFTATRLP